MSHKELQPAIIKHKFFTPGSIILALIAINGLIFLGIRFLYGVGEVTNLNQQYPWGIWNAINKAGGVALAACGFITAAIGHIMHREHYHRIVRPALLLAMLGYTFVGMAVFIDIGRWYYIWHPMIMWNANSALFEVGICVMIYLTVLYIEFLPVVCERFIGRVNLPSILKIFNKPIDTLLRALERWLSGTMFVFIIAGVVLSTLHQSSLGTLMVIAGQKIHPLWQTPILPLLFFLSALAVGFPMVIFQSLIAARSFKLDNGLPILSRLGTLITPLLGFYLAFKIGDIFIRESFVYLKTFSFQSAMFYIEVVIGVIIPMFMFINKKVLKSPILIFTAATLVIFGVFINRINVFIVAYTPPYAQSLYYPSFGEISVSIGFIALIVLLYRILVMIFPVISQPVRETHTISKEAL